MTPHIVDSEIPSDAELELDVSGRNRLRWLCYTYLSMGGIYLVGFAVTRPMEEWSSAGWQLYFCLMGIAAAMVVSAWYSFRASKYTTRGRVMASATTLILLVGILVVGARMLYLEDKAWALIDLALIHLIACLFLPWTARESLQPMIPLLLVWAMLILLPSEGEKQLLTRVVEVIVGPMVLIPGALVASWRMARQEEMLERVRLGRQVKTIGGELSRARIVHDAMFPAPIETGHVGFDYIYSPIAEIGGDYVHFYVCPRSGRTTMTLLDVAGHGLSAALTVNRLFGELERIRAENLDAQPGEVMRLLNRYINLTMAPVNLYATGLCILLDPEAGQLQWVNAGHPPSFLRRRNASELTELSGTAMLLGALEDTQWDPNQEMMEIQPGDVIIAYTDGAFEARDLDGRQFGLDRLRDTARFDPPPRSWTKFLANAVAQHHQGHADDDVLIATLTMRSLRVPSAPPAAAQVDVPERSTVTRSG